MPTEMAVAGRWYRSFFASFTNGLADKDGKPKPPTIQSAYGKAKVTVSGPLSKIPKPTSGEPPLPGGCSIECQERVLVFARKEDLGYDDMARARHWLSWRWIPGYRVPDESQ